MEAFLPGQDYDRVYRVVILVCVNPVNRTFAQCDASSGEAVLEALKRQVSQSPLSAHVYVSTSGCTLGCHSRGATVGVIFQERAPLWYRGVQPVDVETLLNEITRHLSLQVQGIDTHSC